jgi:hypothetical protein
MSHLTLEPTNVMFSVEKDVKPPGYETDHSRYLWWKLRTSGAVPLFSCVLCEAHRDNYVFYVFYLCCINQLLLCHAENLKLLSSRTVTKEAQVRSQVCSCGICGVRIYSGTGTGFFRLLPFSVSLSFYQCSMLLISSTTDAV